jgi:hypothetical protein
MKPTATLTIIQRGLSTSYLLTDAAGRLVWNTRAYSTPEGTAGARARLRAWLKGHPYTVVLAPDAEARRSA